jgi:crossover junction endodeoxyribonuclease RusA
MKLILPLPPKELNPNARLHYYPKAEAVLAYRRDVYVYVCQQSPNRSVLAPTRARMTETYLIAGKRKRDVRNLFAAFKAGEDGLVDAGLLPGDDDSVLEHGAPRIERVKSKAEECVVVEIEEA